MARPIKPRKISVNPECRYFIPGNRTNEKFEKITLKLEELEAIFLKDLEKKDQSESAKEMEVSRQTFQIIIDDARGKIADALVYGKAIEIEGGNYNYGGCENICGRCGKVKRCKFRP